MGTGTEGFELNKPGSLRPAALIIPRTACSSTAKLAFGCDVFHDQLRDPPAEVSPRATPGSPSTSSQMFRLSRIFPGSATHSWLTDPDPCRVSSAEPTRIAAATPRNESYSVSPSTAH